MLNFSKKSKRTRVIALALTLAGFVVAAGCGDTYRPIVIPIQNPGGDPATSSLAFVLSQNPGLANGTCPGGGAPPCAGTVTTLSVPGESILEYREVGRQPMMIAPGPSGLASIYIPNRVDNTVSQTRGTATVSSLPAGSAPVFAASVTEGSVANATVVVANSGTNTASFISASSAAVRLTVPVGSNPVAVGVSSSQRKAYVVNGGSGTVTVLAVADGAQLKTIDVGDDPVWAVSHPSGTMVFVVNRGSGDVSVIDTATDTVVRTISTGTEPVFAIYDPRLLRVYVANRGSNSVSVLDASATSPASVTLIGTAQVGSQPVSIAPLRDGSRVYVANSGSNDVTVIDALSLQPRANTIKVGTRPVSIAAASDSSRVLVANNEYTRGADNSIVRPPGISVIRTSTDTKTVDLDAPFADFANCTSDAACPRQQPVFVVAE